MSLTHTHTHLTRITPKPRLAKNPALLQAGCINGAAALKGHEPVRTLIDHHTLHPVRTRIIQYGSIVKGRPGLPPWTHWKSTDADTETEIHTQTHRDTDKERYRQKQRDRQKQRETIRNKEIRTQMKTHIQRDTNPHRHIEIQRERDTGTKREKYKQIPRKGKTNNGQP